MSFIDDFKARFPEFDTAKVDTAIPNIVPTLPCYYGAEYGSDVCDDQIILMLTAHLFTLETSTGIGSRKDTTSKSVGNVSVSYAAGRDSDLTQFFNTTKYGQQFLLMTRKHAVGGLFV